MNILIIGASGLIGSALFREFCNIYKTFGTYFSSKIERLHPLDIRNSSQINFLITKVSPNVILCPAALANVEYCEQNPEQTRETNVKGIKNIIKKIENKNIKFVFFSSEYIFDGKAGPYTEEDIPNPLNEYGKQKLEVENFIKETLDDYLIIRTTVVYGWEKKSKNFVTGLIRKVKNKEKMKVPIDQFSSPTYVNNLVAAVGELVDRNKIGIYNLVGSEVMNRYTFAKITCQVFNLDDTLLIPVTTEELNQKAKRPLKAGLKIDKVKKEIETKLIDPEKGLEMMKRERKICQI